MSLLDCLIEGTCAIGSPHFFHLDVSNGVMRFVLVFFVRHSDSLQRVTAGERWGVLFLVLLYKYIGPLAHRPAPGPALSREA